MGSNITADSSTVGRFILSGGNSFFFLQNYLHSIGILQLILTRCARILIVYKQKKSFVCVISRKFENPIKEQIVLT